MLEALQRRSSDVWEEYRGQLAAHPDAIKLPAHFIDNGWTRVAVIGSDAPVGFSVVIPGPEGAYELDGLFVEPDHMRRGIGASLVEDACERGRSSWSDATRGNRRPGAGLLRKARLPSRGHRRNPLRPCRADAPRLGYPGTSRRDHHGIVSSCCRRDGPLRARCGRWREVELATLPRHTGTREDARVDQSPDAVVGLVSQKNCAPRLVKGSKGRLRDRPDRSATF